MLQDFFGIMKQKFIKNINVQKNDMSKRSKSRRGMRPTFTIDKTYHCKLHENIYCKVHVGNNAEYFFHLRNNCLGTYAESGKLCTYFQIFKKKIKCQ